MASFLGFCPEASFFRSNEIEQLIGGHDAAATVDLATKLACR
jgi:hypothetical protein